MASITDCVVEGLKYPFNDIKKLLSFGVLCALISVVSTFIGVKSLDIFRATVHIAEKTNGTVSHIPLSQLPVGDMYLVAGLIIVAFIISLLIMGYQYDIIKFSIDKKEDLPGFGDILSMFVNGIKYCIVILAYNIIPILVLVGGAALAGESSIFPIVLLVSMLLFIIAYFLLLMALNNMIAYDSLKKAFDFGEIFDNISNLGWGKYVGIILFTLIVMMIISVAVSFILSFITVLFAAIINNQAFVISIVIAIIEGLFIDSYMGLFFNRVCGSIYRESIK
ncbi:MAG: DUF4013 domain-containing protein [Methanobrevibacter sp.]|uniref:DUF4013 domain-containing protein n=1 Tax=Methanobrevibacter sp. TaxID=66852 RepID=UPI0025F6B8B9|nr:DUF4013 domain-containing protein [Methanobrevibacter sp.]MBR3113238.1 DUF4013 domain-containing protein [Methanobrevibacter sp.]MBR6992715.1 DUF4013 domain-containing protein [Methanobrevibacter sp.]